MLPILLGHLHDPLLTFTLLARLIKDLFGLTLPGQLSAGVMAAQGVETHRPLRPLLNSGGGYGGALSGTGR